MHDPINSPDDLGRELSACLGQTVPSSVGERFARGCELMREAAGQTPRKAKPFLNKAVRAFKRAGRLAASAATRKKGSISPDCAADLRSILSGARDQAGGLRTGG